MMDKEKILNILLVEDDDVAAESVCRSFAKSSEKFPVHLARDGIQALEVLRDTNSPTALNKPYVVLLDLNMPRMNGFEFLHELRIDDRIRDAIVFVLTTSDSHADRSEAYKKNIAGYMVKSAVGPHYCKLIQLLKDYSSTISMPGT